MYLSQQIKAALTAEEVARRYGFEPNRALFIRCPFHDGDSKASLKLYPGSRGWHCFGCGEGGSVIDFVMKLFGLGLGAAEERLNADFGLGLAEERKSRAELSEHARRAAEARAELESYRAEYDRRVAEYRRLWLAQQAGPTHPLYARACLLLPEMERWFGENHWR